MKEAGHVSIGYSRLVYCEVPISAEKWTSRLKKHMHSSTVLALSGGDILWHPANVQKAQGQGVRAPNISVKVEYLSHRYREHYLTSIIATATFEFTAPLSPAILDCHCVQRFGRPLNVLRAHFLVATAHSIVIARQVKILPTKLHCNQPPIHFGRLRRASLA